MPRQEAIMASTWVPQPEVEVVVAADTVVEAPVAATELVDVWAAARPATARAMMAVRIFNRVKVSYNKIRSNDSGIN